MDSGDECTSSPVDAKLIECALCKDEFKSFGEKLPRLMLCGHVFCTQCIEKHAKERDTSVITCLIMCKASILAIQNVKDVKVHESLIQLLETREKLSKADKAQFTVTESVVAAAKQYKINLFDSLAQAKRTCNQLDSKMSKNAYLVAKMTANASDIRRQLTTHFTQARKIIIDALENRLNALLVQVEAQEHRNIKPLLDQQDALASQLASGLIILEEGKFLLKGDDQDMISNATTFEKRIFDFLYQSVACVDKQSQLRSILVNLNDKYLNTILDAIHTRCFVSEIPVIVKLVERPGAIFIEWSEHSDESDNDYLLSAKEYQLQFYQGDIYHDIPGKIRYETIYTGKSTDFLIKDLLPSTTYTFRVRSRASQFADWGMWSEPKTSQTLIPTHKWAPENFRIDCDAKFEYNISDDGRTATRVSSEVATILRSSSACYVLGETISLSIDNTGKPESSDGIGLATNRVDFIQRNLRQPGAIYISSSGMIYKDGNLLKNKLPPLRRGTTVNICAQEFSRKKLRVSFCINNKEPRKESRKESTVEWHLPEIDMNLYFAICFRHIGWSVTIG